MLNIPQTVNATTLIPETAQRFDMLGVPIVATDINGAIATIENCIARDVKMFTCVVDAHCIIEARSNEALMRAYRRCDFAVADGMPLQWLAHLVGRKQLRRVRGTDLMRTLTHISAQRGYRQFYYGGTPNVMHALHERLTQAHPGLKVVGAVSPPFRTLTDREDQAMVRSINAARPHIVWVGLGAPKQELWMESHRDALDAPVIIGVGAAFDFLAGAKPQAPTWMQDYGLEWLFRLCAEPGRLWRRYFHVVPAFAFLAFARVAKSRLGFN